MYERWAGRGADGHMCVTAAMRDWLAREWGVRNAVVVHDKPPAFFKPTDAAGAHELFTRLQPELDNSPAAVPGDCGFLHGSYCGGGDARWGSAAADEFRAAAASPVRRSRRIQAASGSGIGGGDGGEARTLFTETRVGGEPTMRANASGRPALLVSSTSWTPDEDFGILLEALRIYDGVAAADAAGVHGDAGDSNDSAPRRRRSSAVGARRRRRYPDLVVVVTGKGPLRAGYEAQMSALRLSHVAVRTAWLAAEDYPALLGAADLGVCLHTSSSGLDLPMKVVDMFGAGLPVAAARYDVIRELVSEGENGVLFDGPEELAEHLLGLLGGWHDVDPGRGRGNSLGLERLRRGAAAAALERWDENWERCAKPFFL